MKTLESIRGVLQGLVAVAAGIPVSSVILADQGRTPPPGLYATYKPIPVRAYGAPRRSRKRVPAQDCDIPEWTDLEETTISQMHFLLSVNILNKGAEDAAWRLHNANYRSTVREHLFTHGIGWRYASDVRNLTAVSQASLQPRYHVDIHLTLEAEVTDTVLRAAGFSLSITDESNNQLYGDQ